MTKVGRGGAFDRSLSVRLEKRERKEGKLGKERVCRAYGAPNCVGFRSQPLRAGLNSGAPPAVGEGIRECD